MQCTQLLAAFQVRFESEEGLLDTLKSFMPGQTQLRQPIGYRQAPGPWHFAEPTPLYASSEIIKVYHTAQLCPIPDNDPRPADPENISYIEDFTCYTSTGKDFVRQIFKTQPKALPSVLDERLLLRLRETRTSHPPPGVTDPAAYFLGAVRLLLRVLAEALGGSTRAIPTTSKVLNNQLGWDEVVQEIFEKLDWSLGPVDSEDERLAIRPPKLLDEDGRPILSAWRKAGRAWLELSCWAEHCKLKMNIKGEFRK